MGQQHSQSQFEIRDFVPPLLLQMAHEEPLHTLISSEVQTLSYEKFTAALGELNELSKDCLDSEGRRLIFAVKKGTDSTVFWKATVQIACVKIFPGTTKVDNFRLLNLYEFIKVFKTLKCQSSAEQQSRSGDLEGSSENLAMKTAKECCICFERQQEVILPCTHSFCTVCVEEWNERNDTCPICRERLESTDDAWVMSEIPEAEEISKEITSNLMQLTEEKPSPCNPS